MMNGGSLPLRKLRARGFNDERIREIGGRINGRNVIFRDKIAGFSSAGDILKLPATPPAADERMKRDGPKLWGQLHRWALAFQTSSIDAIVAADWLKSFSLKLPCGRCRAHWRHMVDESPPPFTSAEDLFEWTVRRHNEVNGRLGKPKMSVDEARAIHTTRSA